MLEQTTFRCNTFGVGIWHRAAVPGAGRIGDQSVETGRKAMNGSNSVIISEDMVHGDACRGRLVAALANFPRAHGDDNLPLIGGWTAGPARSSRDGD